MLLTTDETLSTGNVSRKKSFASFMYIRIPTEKFRRVTLTLLVTLKYS